MSRKVKISFLVLIWGIVAIQTYINFLDGDTLRKKAVLSMEGYEKSKEAIPAFSVMEDTSCEKQVNGFGFYKTIQLTEEEKRDLLIDFAKKLGIKGEYSFLGGEGSNYKKLTLNKKEEGSETNVSLITLEDGTSVPEQYIYVDTQVLSGEELIYEKYQRLRDAYEAYDMNSNVSFEYTTKEDGNLQEEGSRRTQYLQSLFDEIQGTEVTRMDTKDFHTVYGYTRKESNYYDMGGAKVNVQVVFSYSEADDVTYIKIGCPIVNSSY